MLLIAMRDLISARRKSSVPSAVQEMPEEVRKQPAGSHSPGGPELEQGMEGPGLIPARVHPPPDTATHVPACM